MNINLSLKQFSDQGCEPREILTQAQALEAAGYKVNLQLRNWKDMELLVQQPTVQKALPKPHRLSLPSLIVLGALGALASVVFGWMGI
jgi:hypothetical protein